MAGMPRCRAAALALCAALLLLAVPASGSVVNGGGYRYVLDKLDLPANQNVTQRAPCPGHTHVLSGGFIDTGPLGEVRLSHSFPYDGDDPNQAPDDGWAVKLRDAAGTFVKVQAVCAPIPTHYIESVQPVPAHGQVAEGTFDIHCASDYHSVLSGGTNGSFQLRETRSAPVAESSGPDRWRGMAFNESDRDLQVTGIAVCANLNTTWFAPSQPITTAGSQVNHAVHCDDGDRAIGGGYYTFPGTGLTVTTSGPFGYGDDPSSDGWQVTVDDTAGGNLIQVMLLCSGPL